MKNNPCVVVGDNKNIKKDFPLEWIKYQESVKKKNPPRLKTARFFIRIIKHRNSDKFSRKRQAATGTFDLDRRPPPDARRSPPWKIFSRPNLRSREKASLADDGVALITDVRSTPTPRG
jgi:hypothetical protein